MNEAKPVKKFSLKFQSDFERDLETEILKSEKFRSLLLACLFALVGFYYFVSFTFFRSFIDSVFHGKLDNNLPQYFFWCMAVYEIFFCFVITGFHKKGLRMPLPPKIGNALLETSFPSFLILGLSNFFGPVVALNSPPSVLYFIFIVFSALRMDYRVSLFTGFVGSVEYALIVWYLIGNVPASDMSLGIAQYISKAFLILFTGVITSFVAHRSRQGLVNLLKSHDEKNRITSMFGQHVSPAVMNKLLHQDVFSHSENRFACIMFLDIRNFTTFSQSRTPEEVVNYLNTLFDFMINIVNKHNGIINKFLGDGFMAVFGAPVSDGRASINAMAAAVEIVEKVNELNEQGTILPTRIGIGLHCGQALTGLVGSSLRQEYTVIGDVVNLASRIESLNKHFSSQLLMSVDVQTSIKILLDSQGDETGLSSLLQDAKNHGPVMIKGRDEAVEIIQVL